MEALPNNELSSINKKRWVSFGLVMLIIDIPYISSVVSTHLSKAKGPSTHERNKSGDRGHLHTSSGWFTISFRLAIYQYWVGYCGYSGNHNRNSLGIKTHLFHNPIYIWPLFYVVCLADVKFQCHVSRGSSPLVLHIV